MVPSFTSLDSAALLHTKNNILSSLVKSSLVKVETSCTMILPPTASILCRWLLREREVISEREERLEKEIRSHDHIGQQSTLGKERKPKGKRVKERKRKKEDA